MITLYLTELFFFQTESVPAVNVPFTKLAQLFVSYFRLFALFESFEVDNGVSSLGKSDFPLPLSDHSGIFNAFLDPLELNLPFVFKHQIQLANRVILGKIFFQHVKSVFRVPRFIIQV